MLILHKAQELFGCLPVEVQEYIEESLDIPLTDIWRLPFTVYVAAQA